MSSAKSAWTTMAMEQEPPDSSGLHSLISLNGPIFFLARIAGFGNLHGYSRFIRMLYGIYTTAIMLLLFCSLGFILAQFRTFNNSFAFNADFVALLCYTVWNCQACFGGSYMVYMTRRGQVAAVGELFQKCDLYALIYGKKRLKRQSYIATGACCFYFMVTFTMLAVQIFVIKPQATAAVAIPTANTNWIMLIFSPWLNAAWTLPSAMYFLNANIVAMSVQGLADEVMASTDLEQTIRKLTVDFNSLCKFIDAMENGMKFKVFCGVTLFFNVPTLICQVYIFTVEDTATTFMKIQMGIWAVSQTLQIFILGSAAHISLRATALNGALYSKYVEHVTNCDVEDKRHDEKMYHQANILLNQLGNSNIGFTVWDLFLITPSTIVTMLSVVVTYYIVIVQVFGLSSGPVTCNCGNSTFPVK